MRKSESGPRTQKELKRKKLASTPGLLVLLCGVQFLAEHFSCPVRYRLCGFTQFATDEMRDYSEAATMRCIVVHEQFIGMFGDFGEIIPWLPIRVNHTGHRHGLSTFPPCAPHPAPNQTWIF